MKRERKNEIHAKKKKNLKKHFQSSFRGEKKQSQNADLLDNPRDPARPAARRAVEPPERREALGRARVPSRLRRARAAIRER